MGLVQSGFFGAVLMYPRDFGIKCTDSELDDYIHVWRVIGYCLGIKDQYNICSGTLEQTRALVKEIEQECLIPALLSPPKDFDEIADAYIDGLNSDLSFKLHSKLSILSLIWNGFERVRYCACLREGFSVSFQCYTFFVSRILRIILE